jgi:catechol 2,3-dioxygenase-like lactoylglutathione lyase family enzyme
MAIEIDRLDHLVLTCRNIEKTCTFYEKVLGMTRESFGEGRVALKFGRQKINLHPHPTPHQPLVADVPVPGTADLCFIATTPMPAAWRISRPAAFRSSTGRWSARARSAR